jgi:hypothetical protein
VPEALGLQRLQRPRTPSRYHSVGTYRIGLNKEPKGRGYIKLYWWEEPMAAAATVELKAQATRFFSQLDGTAFFEWLKKLPCVSKFEGRGDTLSIRVLESKVDEYALRELLALFHRYRLDMKQLSVFDKQDFAGWFRNTEAYWYKSVFGS